MTTLISVFLFILGLGLIIKGGDLFVNAASSIAERFGIPKFIIGATVVSLATTLPEIIVSLLAAADGRPTLALGNAVGSVSANTGLILAVSVIIAPLYISRKCDGIKCLIMVLCIATLYLSSMGGTLSYVGAAVLLVLLAIFIFDSIKNAKTDVVANTAQRSSLLLDTVFFILGAAGIAVGAQLLVNNASILARAMGISEAVISATIIAVGTSLPELVTAISAAAKKQQALSLGNIVGANIIDTAVILPACSLLSGYPIPISRQGITVDMPVCLFLSALAVFPALVRGKFSRFQGIVMLGAYIAYIVFIVFLK